VKDGEAVRVLRCAFFGFGMVEKETSTSGSCFDTRTCTALIVGLNTLALAGNIGLYKSAYKEAAMAELYLKTKVAGGEYGELGNPVCSDWF